MTDDIGIWQHAMGPEPDHRFGYCTDDVARLLVVDVLHARQGLAAVVEPEIRRSLAFLGDAFVVESGRFRNFRRAGGEWLDGGASEDCQARALAGAAAVIAGMPGTEPARRARELLDVALPAVASFESLRPIARGILACDAVLGADGVEAAEGVPDGPDARSRGEIMPLYELLVGRLSSAFDRAGVDPAAPRQIDWPWPEPIVTYENALLLHALIVAGQRLGRPSDVARGLAVLDWLIDAQIGAGGSFSGVGNSHWWHRDGGRSQFDQQPIEAATMVAACAAAYAATGDRGYADAAESAYGWFLGDNDLGVALADPLRGACHDGLRPTDVNANQGAESTIMWLTALEQVRALRLQVERQPSHRSEAETVTELRARP
jgi:hypothetical protein